MSNFMFFEGHKQAMTKFYLFLVRLPWFAKKVRWNKREKDWKDASSFLLKVMLHKMIRNDDF